MSVLGVSIFKNDFAVAENLPSEINIYSSQTVDLEFRKTWILVCFGKILCDLLTCFLRKSGTVICDGDLPVVFRDNTADGDRPWWCTVGTIFDSIFYEWLDQQLGNLLRLD